MKHRRLLSDKNWLNAPPPSYLRVLWIPAPVYNVQLSHELHFNRIFSTWIAWSKSNSSYFLGTSWWSITWFAKLPQSITHTIRQEMAIEWFCSSAFLTSLLSLSTIWEQRCENEKVFLARTWDNWKQVCLCKDISLYSNLKNWDKNMIRCF